jgi:hypothetical protein
VILVFYEVFKALFGMGLFQFGELRAVKNAGQVLVFGGFIFIDLGFTDDPPEILCFQIVKIGCFNEEADDGISCFERYGYRRFAYFFLG